MLACHAGGRGFESRPLRQLQKILEKQYFGVGFLNIFGYNERLQSFKRGAVVQLVRMLACHAGGRGFESRPLRQLQKILEKQYFGVGFLNIFGYNERLQSFKRGAVVQLVRMLACHAGGRGFESRPLRQFLKAPGANQGLFFCLKACSAASLLGSGPKRGTLPDSPIGP